MGAKLVLILIAVCFLFIAAISSASPIDINNRACAELLAGIDMIPSVQVYGQQNQIIIQNSRGELLFIARSEHKNNIGAKGPGAIPIDYISFKIAKIMGADKTKEIEPILLKVVLENIYLAGVRPTYRPLSMRKSYAFKLPGVEQPLVAVEHIQHLDSMTDSQRESITAKIISEFEKR